MDIFIEKNMLLDMIIEQNEYVLSTFNSFSITKVIETITLLRENLNQNDDIILLNRLIDEIKYLIFENNEYIKMFYIDSHDSYNNYNSHIEDINYIISDLEDSINKINEFINKLNSADSLSELMENITL
jgi:glutaredoxin 2